MIRICSFFNALGLAIAILGLAILMEWGATSSPPAMVRDMPVASVGAQKGAAIGYVTYDDIRKTRRGFVLNRFATVTEYPNAVYSVEVRRVGSSSWRIVVPCAAPYRALDEVWVPGGWRPVKARFRPAKC